MFQKCSYCGKRVGDIPTHLEKSEKCQERHTKKLLNELDEILKNPLTKKKIENYKEKFLKETK